MNPISHKLQIVLKQKQILTPALMQMVRILQLNRLELKDMIAEEIAQNPCSRKSARRRRDHAGRTPGAARDPGSGSQSDRHGSPPTDAGGAEAGLRARERAGRGGTGAEPETTVADTVPEPVVSPEDAFGQVDLDEFFRDFNEPGFRTPASDDVDKPGFEFFLWRR